MKKNEAIKIVHEAAHKYEQYLVGKKTLVLFFKDKKQIDSLEVSFMATNFLHLTGFVHNLRNGGFGYGVPAVFQNRINFTAPENFVVIVKYLFDNRKHF